MKKLREIIKQKEQKEQKEVELRNDLLSLLLGKERASKLKNNSLETISLRENIMGDEVKREVLRLKENARIRRMKEEERKRDEDLQRRVECFLYDDNAQIRRMKEGERKQEQIFGKQLKEILGEDA